MKRAEEVDQWCTVAQDDIIWAMKNDLVTLAGVYKEGRRKSEFCGAGGGDGGWDGTGANH